MSNNREDEQDEALSDDSLAYERAQVNVQAEDPLAAIKQMRLEQLAMCRLKSDEEMQAMREALQSAASETGMDDE